MRKATIALLSTALLGVWPPAKLAAVRFFIAPPTVNLEAVPGGMQTRVLNVTNADSGRTLHLKAYAGDWDLNDKNETVFSKAGTTNRTCASWIEINPVDFEVKPRSDAAVRFTLVMPDTAVGSHWAVIFFESLPESLPPLGGMGINLQARVGAMIFADALGTLERKVEIAGLGYRRKGYQNHDFTVRLVNRGNAYVRPKGTVIIRSAENKDILRAPLTEGVLLPGRQRDYLVSVKAVIPPGNYNLVVEVDCGLAEILQGEIAFTVTQ